MIPEYAITEWRQHAPWVNSEQVEQDLLISRALVEIFKHPYLSQSLAFRGGTALHKIYLHPQNRYSEDIDLVQIHPEPIKKTIDSLRKVLSFLGDPIIKQKKNNNTLIFKVDSEILPIMPLRIKIEINCKEHFSAFDYKEVRFYVQNQWFADSCALTTYILEELMGTKLRALYQRRKGRDLYDLYKALQLQDVNIQRLIYAFKMYMRFSVTECPSQKMFLQNLEKKIFDEDFVGDTALLLRPDEDYDISKAFEYVKNEIILKI
jgi:predicted nucleotidyltransferase component of viral defense system